MPNQKHMKHIEFLKKCQNHWTLICILYLSPKCIRLSTVSCLLMESKQVHHHHICNKTQKIKLYINIYKSQIGILYQQKVR